MPGTASELIVVSTSAPKTAVCAAAAAQSPLLPRPLSLLLLALLLRVLLVASELALSEKFDMSAGAESSEPSAAAPAVRIGVGVVTKAPDHAGTARVSVKHNVAGPLGDAVVMQPSAAPPPRQQ